MNKVERIKAEALKAQALLNATVKLAAAKSTDRDGAFRELLSNRHAHIQAQMLQLDAAMSDVAFRLEYAKLKSVSEEYSTLLGLLAEPEKGVEEIETEMAEIAKRLKAAEAEAGTAQDQY